jgi:integrase
MSGGTEINPDTGKPKTIRTYGGGLRSKIRTDRDGQPVEIFHGRVWVKSLQTERTFTLRGRKESSARRELAVIQADPEKVIAAKLAARTAAKEQKAAAYTVAHLYRDFTANYRGHGATDYYLDVLRPLKDAIGETGANDVTPATFDSYFRKRQSGRTAKGRPRVGDSTKRKEIIAANKMFRWARRRGLATVDPLADYDRPKEPAGPPARALTFVEEDRILAALPPLEADYFRLLCDTGLRRDEGRLLTWAQIDKAAGVVHVVSGKGKRAKSRGVPLNLSDRLPAIMERHPRRIGTPYLFHDSEGQPMDVDRLNGALEAAIKAAGVQRTRGTLWNVTRRTAENRMFDAGQLAQHTCDILGHSLAIADKHYREHQTGKRPTAGLLNRPPAPTGAGTGASVPGGAQDAPLEQEQVLG